jgi:hypothetical protein
LLRPAGFRSLDSGSWLPCAYRPVYSRRGVCSAARVPAGDSAFGAGRQRMLWINPLR